MRQTRTQMYEAFERARVQYEQKKSQIKKPVIFSIGRNPIGKKLTLSEKLISFGIVVTGTGNRKRFLRAIESKYIDINLVIQQYHLVNGRLN